MSQLQISSDTLLYNADLLESLDDAAIATDENFIIKKWNKAAKRIYGIPAKKALGKKRTDVLKYNYAGCSEPEAIKIVLGEGTWKGVIEFERFDKRKITLQSTVTTITNELGAVVGYVGLNRDVTAETESKKNLENFNSLLSALEDNYVIVDKDFTILFHETKKVISNNSLFDYEVGANLLKYPKPERKAFVHLNLLKAFFGKQSSYEYNFRGDEWLQIIYIPLKGTDGLINNVCCIIKDVTQKKQIELFESKKQLTDKKLYESRIMFEEFMEKNPMLAWVTDSKGAMQYMNSAFLRNLCFTENEIGKNIFDLFPEDLAQEYFINNKKVLDQKTAIESLEKALQPDGTIKAYKIIKFPILFNTEIMVAGWAADLSPEIQLQEKLIEINDFKDKLVSTIAHDLRSPFSVLLTFTDLLLRDFDSYSRDDLKESMKMILNSSEKVYNLLEELLLWGKSQLNNTEYKAEIFNIADNIKLSIDTLTKQCKDKKINISERIDQYDEAFGDINMFRIAMRNIASNAIKFSPFNSTIIIEAIKKDGFIECYIKDEGVGMSDETMNKILNGSNCKSSEGTDGEKGIGLGLNLSKNFIEKNHGKLWIDNSSETGCTFCFTIPAAM